MQPLPEGWPIDSGVETLPEIFLQLPGSEWPPAIGSVPRGTAELGSWSVSRSLTGSLLPGQVRGATGFSIATGSASFAQPEGSPLSPWARGPNRLSPGGDCILYASHGGASLAAGIRLGRFVVAPISGANTSNDVYLELDENSIRLRKPLRLGWEYDPTKPSFDASEVLRAIAAKAGYASTDIQDSGSMLSGIFDLSGQDSWTVAQDIAKATLGAVWISESGVFTYRNRDSLRGVGAISETVEALDAIESLAWSIDPSDVADRVELTYTPTEVREDSEASNTVWEATSPIRVRGRQSLTVYADIEGTTPQLDSPIPLWATDNWPANVRSRWAASTSPSGGGTRPADNAIRVSLSMVSPSRIRIDLLNQTDDHLWLVDGNGDPCLILRARVYVVPGEEATVAIGASEESAMNSLTIPAGSWVQDAETARQLCAWAAGQSEFAQATVDQVRVKPNLARQIGDVIRLTDGRTNLLSKALITGVSLSGDGSGYSQRLDLALLDITFHEWDQWMATRGINTFGELDAFLQRESLNTFEAFDEWGQDFGGTL